MAIFLPGAAEDQALALDEMTPREIVAELDKYVVGQHAAKRAVAIALRNPSSARRKERHSRGAQWQGRERSKADLGGAR